MTNKIQNKIFAYHESLTHDIVKQNQAKMKAMADKHGQAYFDRFIINLALCDMDEQRAIDECWAFFGMEPKECSYCANYGSGIVFPSICSNCAGTNDKKNWRKKHA